MIGQVGAMFSYPIEGAVNATSVVSPSATPHLRVYGVAEYAVGEVNVAVSEFAAEPSVNSVSS